jgi:ectoine hydroxylase-related dioxygenase (phytanoyl-CoA dioxygenase family)
LIQHSNTKLNFGVLEKFSIGELKGFDDHVYQPAMKKGDVIFFSEATVHGAMAWKRDEQRRLALYRFAPSNFAYGRGYLNHCGVHVSSTLSPK